MEVFLRDYWPPEMQRRIAADRFEHSTSWRYGWDIDLKIVPALGHLPTAAVSKHRLNDPWSELYHRGRAPGAPATARCTWWPNALAFDHLCHLRHDRLKLNGPIDRTSPPKWFWSEVLA